MTGKDNVKSNRYSLIFKSIQLKNRTPLSGLPCLRQLALSLPYPYRVILCNYDIRRHKSRFQIKGNHTAQPGVFR